MTRSIVSLNGGVPTADSPQQRLSRLDLQRKKMGVKTRCVITPLLKTCNRLLSPTYICTAIQFALRHPIMNFRPIITFCAFAVGSVVFLWAVGELGAHLANKISFRLVGRRTTWWNREFKGTWLWASPIGLVVSALITSSLFRWLLLVLSALGCLFALIFRLTRPTDEI